MNRYLAATFAGIAAIVGMTNAQAATTMSGAGHYEWRIVNQRPGPRAPIVAPRRVWISSTPSEVQAAADRSEVAGHFEWRVTVSPGPRGTPVSRQVWVPTPTMMARAGGAAMTAEEGL